MSLVSQYKKEIKVIHISSTSTNQKSKTYSLTIIVGTVPVLAFWFTCWGYSGDNHNWYLKISSRGIWNETFIDIHMPVSNNFVWYIDDSTI